MARNVFRNGASLLKVLENSPIGHLKQFLLQPDENFKKVCSVIEAVFEDTTEDDQIRQRLLNELNDLPNDDVEPIEVECRRVLELAEGKGPTSLQTLVDKRLSNEECEEYSEQPGELAKSLWMHVHHRAEFDDAVSFGSVRSLRSAGQLFSAFHVQLAEPHDFRVADVDEAKLIEAIAKKLGTRKELSISWVELPEVKEYPPSVLVIIRFPGRQASVAVHGTGGTRRLVYFLPQDEAILIYTPALERIEVAAAKVAVRRGVADCFARESLNHDISAKPLTTATYDTSRFLNSLDLPLPDVPDFLVLSTKVVELELRIDKWQTRLSLKAGAESEMAVLVQKYLDPAQVLRQALGVSRVLIAVTFQHKKADQQNFLEIMISDRNSCSLKSERDPEIQNLGRKLLAAWGITDDFRDLEPREALLFLPLMAELWEIGQATQAGDYFASRGIDTARLVQAALIRRKEVAPILIDHEDGGEDGPSIEDRTIYSIDLDWLSERLVSALRSVVDGGVVQELAPGLFQLGVMQIDEQDIPCYLARGLEVTSVFNVTDERLRARSGVGAGIVFTGRSVGRTLIGANVLVSLVSTVEGSLSICADREAFVRSFRSGRSLAFGAGTLEIVKEGDDLARLHVPGRDPLDLFGANHIHAFDLLVKSAQRGGPGVKTSELLGGKKGQSLENMFGQRRWKIVSSYIVQVGHGAWQLRMV